MDKCPTADFCSSPPAEFSLPCPEIWIADNGPCDYDIRHNFNAQYVYELPFKVHSHAWVTW